jgi:hypothetical protein
MNSRAEPTGMAVPACIGKRRLKDKFRRATSDYLRMLTAQLTAATTGSGLQLDKEIEAAKQQKSTAEYAYSKHVREHG